MWRGVGLILLCLLTFVLGVGRSAITDSDEAYYAEAGREMLASGDWITPHYNFEPRLQKPVLMYWLIAATYRVMGVSEWAARIWSALAGMGLALVAAVVAWRWCGSREGLLSGAIVATSFGVVPLARQSLPDVPLAFFVSVAIWAAIEAVTALDRPAAVQDRPHRVHTRVSPRTWLYLCAIAMGFGMVAKGPVAVVLPVTVIAPLVWFERRNQSETAAPFPLRAGHFAVAAVLFVLVAAPWYLVVIQAQGAGYLRQFFVGENVERFATATYNSWRGWIYGPVIVAGLLPWSAFASLWFRPLVQWRKGRQAITSLDRRLLCWTLGPLMFFMLSVGSQPRYILPCLVPLSIMLARSIWSHAMLTDDTPRRRLFLVLPVLASGIVVLLGLLLWRAGRVIGVAADSNMASLELLSLGISAIGLLTAILAVVLPRRTVPAAIAAMGAAVLIMFDVAFLSPGRPEPVEVIAAAVRAEGPGVDVCACGALARSLNFYTHSKVEIANVTPDFTEELQRFLDRPGRVLAAVDSRALERLEASLGQRFPRLTEVAYFNTSLWQRGETIVSPDPSLVQRVILIANR